MKSRKKVSLLPSQPNESLIAGLECLEVVAAATAPMGTRELARRTEMNHTRVNRLVRTLAHLGLLERTSKGQYAPGPGIHMLAAVSLQGSPLLRVALPIAKLWWEQGYVVTVGVLWKRDVCHLLHARPDRPFEAAIGGHETSPSAYSTAGLALLAALPAAGTRGWKVPPKLEWIDPDEPLATSLAHVRTHGYAVRRYADGRVSVGVQIGRPPVAGLAVSKVGMDDEQAVVERLKADAEQIERNLHPPA